MRARFVIQEMLIKTTMENEGNAQMFMSKFLLNTQSRHLKE